MQYQICPRELAQQKANSASEVNSICKYRSSDGVTLAKTEAAEETGRFMMVDLYGSPATFKRYVSSERMHVLCLLGVRSLRQSTLAVLTHLHRS